jgi:hypothetical protein
MPFPSTTDIDGGGGMPYEMKLPNGIVANSETDRDS